MSSVRLHQDECLLGRGRKSYLELKSSKFRARILAEATSMTHSDMLHRLEVSTLYFYEPLLFQNFVS